LAQGSVAQGSVPDDAAEHPGRLRDIGARAVCLAYKLSGLASTGQRPLVVASGIAPRSTLDQPSLALINARGGFISARQLHLRHFCAPRSLGGSASSRDRRCGRRRYLQLMPPGS
jgi:hypothetical protein